MKYFLYLLTTFTLSQATAFAQVNNSNTTCEATEPCLYNKELGYCLSSMNIEIDPLDDQLKVTVTKINVIKGIAEAITSFPVSRYIGRGNQGSGFIGSNEDNSITLLAAGSNPEVVISDLHFPIKCTNQSKSKRL